MRYEANSPEARRLSVANFILATALVMLGVLVVAWIVSFIDVALYALTAMAPLMIRLPKSPWVQVKLPDGTMKNVPTFITFDAQEVVAFGAGELDSRGFSTTKVMLRNGSHFLLSTFEDEFSFILEEVLDVTDVHVYRYQQHEKALEGYRNRIRGEAEPGTSTSGSPRGADKPEKDLKF